MRFDFHIIHSRLSIAICIIFQTNLVLISIVSLTIYWIHIALESSDADSSALQDLAKIIQCLIHKRVSVSHEIAPAPEPAPFRFKSYVASPDVVPWWEQKRHMTFVDSLQREDRVHASRLANQRQYYMGP